MYLDIPNRLASGEVWDRYRARRLRAETQEPQAKKQMAGALRDGPFVAGELDAIFKCPNCQQEFGSLNDFGDHLEISSDPESKARATE